MNSKTSLSILAFFFLDENRKFVLCTDERFVPRTPTTISIIPVKEPIVVDDREHLMVTTIIYSRGTAYLYAMNVNDRLQKVHLPVRTETVAIHRKYALFFRQ